MRVTRVMKDYVEEQMNAKFDEIMKAQFQDYADDKAACKAEIEKLVPVFKQQVDDILTKYDMDIKSDDWPVVGWYPNRISNRKKDDERDNFRCKLKAKKNDSLKRFYLECDLGINRQEFYDLVENLVSGL